MRLTRWLLAVWIGGVLVLLPAESLASHRPDHLELSARAAAVIDVQSGRILYEKKAGQQMRIASLTKIMTAIVAIENSDLTEKVKVKPGAVGVEGSSIYLKPGEEIPLEHLLYGLMLRSGNDAAVAIAEHVGGSVEGFVYKMNEKAEYLGLRNTHFQNPHGLDAKEHYSSAEDLARLTAYALKNPEFRKIVSTQVKTVPWPGEEWHRKWYNKNKMLRLYPGGDGVKTGFTKLSRRTLVSSATREGRQIATVTLNAPNDWEDSMRLLEYGFRHFQRVRLVKKGEEFSSGLKGRAPLEIVASRSFTYPLTEEERDRVEVRPMITYPLKKAKVSGIRVGTARIFVEGKPVGSIPLITRGESEETVWGDWFTVLASIYEQEG
ncbi:D-alanyl-D-alanine carboxypeptidase family protein [Kroppenstedtia eburnea]|uniref:serine-type D-Ala-D-Ala carboxypeptidase n=1 Tax=Kroppenstedtia eburnea TaxID=714067 RepID=A0A1N7INU7_9BACL|nr:D-alanyl-D-alanine carboxypeptidase family protein [Kroppenstedtia eburnea]EGK14172.1 serine-type D-Ala-D-Ala carboxypeptidase [Desmospora sp. 8437]QKI82017.1 D-alanyl-D-alanine carboxypeptidase [Kroppenstedtia eburnea]SIS38730.1 D-alanyl-D-alanine carboxypeptidase [Kroppenstedtia eburnea]